MNSLLCKAKRFLKRKWLFALLGAFLVHPAWATIPLYQNYNLSQYSIPGNPPPQIDATAFDNENTFSIDWTTFNPDTPFYETLNTLFYTNNGTILANVPTTTNGVSLLTLNAENFAVGYQFDLLTSTQNYWADTFYNAGTIRCASILDGNNSFIIGTIFGSQLVSLATFGECVVSATNIINPGTVRVSEDGLINFSGQNVNLQGGQFVVEPPLFLTGLFGTVAFGGIATFGLETNFLWNPALDLGANTAVSSYSPFPNILRITNSTAYLDDEVDPFNASNIIHRAVFIEDHSDPLTVTYNVFFDPLTTSTLGFELGTMNVGWKATYTDPATGGPVNKYLYLVDNPVFGATTNVAVVNGYPDNFELIQSPTQQLFGPAPAGFVPEFPFIYLTNFYAYMSGLVLASTASTNVSYQNPHGTITNLPGQLYITASNELNLAFTTITGPNYMNLNCTNQFDGSPGAAISAPFADIALGVTNGFLTISNTLTANLPNWNGPLRAWSTRFTIEANGLTNDYRIMIVYSALRPTTPPWVQNCYLHGSNSLVLSDRLNVYSSFYSDAAVLTLITNQVGVGATSLDGELFWDNQATFNANSGSGLQQMPNLLWLTNSGLIRTVGNFVYGNAAAPQFVLAPGTPPATNYTAFVNHSLVADQGTTILTSYFENDGTISNGAGSFILHSGQAALTNGNIVAGADVLIVATNVPQMGMNGILVSNQTIQAGRALTLVATNILGDAVTNGNIFVVGANSGGGPSDSGFNIPIKASGNLLGTTVTNISPYNKTIYNVWSGKDYGISNQGYTNNLALGHLVLDMLTTNTNPSFVFSGAGVSNALYVDLLELKDGAANNASSSPTNVYNLLWLKINTNMFIYYARAVRNVNGQLFDASEAIDDQSKIGANGGRLRWIWSYAGFYSSTNVYFTNSSGVVITNTVNTYLAQSSTIDSDSDGIPNNLDPTPFFLSPELKFTAATTNLPPQSVKVQWTTIPNATNFVYYTTNLLSTNWQAFTNFSNWYYGNNVAVTNAAHGNSFHSPQVYISNPALPDNSQQTNVWIYDVITNVPHYYKVVVWPWINFPE